MSEALSRVIVGYDVRADRAQELLEELAELGAGIKVGDELFMDALLDDLKYATSYAALLLKRFLDHPATRMLDNKYNDTWDRVQKKLRVATRMGIDVVTLHIDGGDEMMTKALEEAARQSSEYGTPVPNLFGVTILTSLTYPQLVQLGKVPFGIDAQVEQNQAIAARVYELAMLAKSCGMQGVVAAPTQLGMLRSLLDDNFRAITPGVRSPGKDAGAQARVGLPEEALKDGAWRIVVASEVVNAKGETPREALLRIGQRIIDASA